MKKFKYIILGGGCAGLSLAVSLLRKGETDFVLLEREDTTGGLCRNTEVDGGPLDFGGHVLDVRRPEVVDFMFSFLPKEEWKHIVRENTVKLVSGIEVGYPLEANIWQMDEDDQNEFLDSIAKAGCQNGEEMPEKFSDWVKWKFGDKIADEYMIPYNKKLWNENYDNLATYWLYKLPNVSYEDTLESCKQKKPFGSMPAHSSFYYPIHYGYGETFRRMAEYLGDHVVTGYNVTDVDYESKTINGEYQAEKIISTIPWREISGRFPDDIKSEIDKLKYVSIDVDYYDKEHDDHTQITYCADPSLPYHRVLYRNTFLEIDGLKGYWTEANSKIGCKEGKVHIELEYAYPVNTFGKREAVQKVKEWAEQYGIISFSRWGNWEHINSDAAMLDGINLAEELTK